MGLFSKKPGGTFFGNLLRGVASTATGGILGSGANRIELGQTKTNLQLAQEQAAAQVSAGGSVSQDVLDILNGKQKKDNTVLYVCLGVVGFLGIMLIAFKDQIFVKRKGAY